MLWSFIDIEFSRPMIKLCLIRSKSALLTIKASRSIFAQQKDAVGDMEKLRLIMEHWTRICDLELEDAVYRAFKAVWDEKRIAGTKNIEMWRLCCCRGSAPQRGSLDDRPVLDWSEIIQASSVTSLSLFQAYAKWEDLPLHNLTKLQLSDIRSDDKRPKITDVLNILKRSPALEILDIEGAGPLDAPTDASTEIELSELQHLRLYVIDFAVCMKLLRFIKISGPVSWEIFCDRFPILEPHYNFPKHMAPNPCHSLRMDLYRFAMSFDINLITYPRIHRSNSLALCLDENISIPDWAAKFLDAANWMAELFPWRDIQSLVISSDAGHEKFLSGSKVEDWVRLLSSFRSLKKLDLSNSTMPDTQLLSALSQFTSGKILCGKLDTLALKWSQPKCREEQSTEILMNFLRFRKLHGAPIMNVQVRDVHGVRSSSLEELVRRSEWNVCRTDENGEEWMNIFVSGMDDEMCEENQEVNHDDQQALYRQEQTCI